MTSDHEPIDRFLAAALCGEAGPWPVAWSDADTQALAWRRASYHGIAGLLAARPAMLEHWPVSVAVRVRDEAVAMAMWELRHRPTLAETLEALAATGVGSILLKGTALAYSLYPQPASRARADTDLLVAPDTLAGARACFERLGFRRTSFDDGIADDLALQEVWSLDVGDGTAHHIDLHWQPINAPSLRDVLTVERCFEAPDHLPALGPAAQVLNRPLSLLHCCVHRLMHRTSPYFVDGETYYGADRLIWAVDIDLLARAMSDEDWASFASIAVECGVAEACADGLEFARGHFNTPIPAAIADALAAVSEERSSTYLLRLGQAERSMADLGGLSSWRHRLRYAVARGLPSRQFMRRKYQRFDRWPLALLYLFRFVSLLKARASGGNPG